MRLPWVSRTALELARDEVAMLRAALLRQLDRYDALVLRVTTPAVSPPVLSFLPAATVATPTLHGTTTTATVVSPVAERIRQESGGDPKVAAHFWKYAADLKKQGKAPAEIAELIGWTTADPQPENTPS